MNAIADADHYERQARRASLGAAIRIQLRDELLSALLNDPQREVSTPGYRMQSMTAADLVSESFADRSGDLQLHLLLKMVADASKGEDVQLRAAMWLSIAAEQHAKFHMGDALDAAEGSGE